MSRLARRLRPRLTPRKRNRDAARGTLVAQGLLSRERSSDKSKSFRLMNIVCFYVYCVMVSIEPEYIVVIMRHVYKGSLPVGWLFQDL